ELEFPGEIWVMTTLQAYNLLDYPRLVQWIAQLQLPRFDRCIRMHALRKPTHLSLQIFPEETKVELREVYGKFATDLEGFAFTDGEKNHYRLQTQGILRLLEEPFFQSELQEFFFRSEQMDRRRDQSLQSA